MPLTCGPIKPVPPSGPPGRTPGAYGRGGSTPGGRGPVGTPVTPGPRQPSNLGPENCARDPGPDASSRPADNSHLMCLINPPSSHPPPGGIAQQPAHAGEGAEAGETMIRVAGPHAALC